MCCTFRVYANSEEEAKTVMQSNDRTKIIEMCNRTEGTCFACPFRVIYTKDVPSDTSAHATWTLRKHEHKHMHPLNLNLGRQVINEFKHLHPFH